MESTVYVTKNGGNGGVLSYSQKSYEKLKDTLKKAGYRKATVDEISKYYDLEEIKDDAVVDAGNETKTQPKTNKKKNNESLNDSK